MRFTGANNTKVSTQFTRASIAILCHWLLLNHPSQKKIGAPPKVVKTKGQVRASTAGTPCESNNFEVHQSWIIIPRM